jgi:hypothetical protein
MIGKPSLAAFGLSTDRISEDETLIGISLL